MMNFDALFLDVARRESFAIQVLSRGEVAPGLYLFREYYCNDPNCDCRRVLLHVTSAETRRVVATINYSFEPEKPPFDDDPQSYLDPINPQSAWSDEFLNIFDEKIAADGTYRDLLIRHYEMWKSVVNDPTHPDHPKVRSQNHGSPRFRPAFPARAPSQRSAPRVGTNAPCPCGSGKKYKRCCGR